MKNEKIKRCPKCGETNNLDMERSPWGDSICRTCGYKAPHDEFYDNDDPKNILFTDDYDDEKYIAEYKEYIEAKGGDGTLLRAINLYRDKGKPFFGIGAGTVNFLMNEPGFMGRATPTEDAKFRKLYMIKATVTFDSYLPRGGGMTQEVTTEVQAFNDIMIGGDMNSWITFDVEEKDEFFGTFKGGGLIFSTPQGSTGINKNNNGSILPLDSYLWSITGDKTNRKIDYVIKPRKTIVDVKSRTPITVWADGTNHVINNVKRIVIESGDEVTVIFNDYSAFKRKRRL